MSRRRTTALPALALALSLALVGCGGEEEHPEGHDAGEASETPSPSETAQGTETPDETETTDETAEPAETGTRIELTRTGDSFSPNGQRVEAAVGEPITLVITSDVPGEMHVHSMPEQDIVYGAGTSEHEVTIERPGVVEVESHDPDLVVLQLEVR
jgi:hypothetical protein